MNVRATAATFGEFARNGLGVPVLVMVILAMMVLPLPAFLLDVFFTFNISLSIMILLAFPGSCGRPVIATHPPWSAKRASRHLKAAFRPFSAATSKNILDSSDSDISTSVNISAP